MQTVSLLIAILKTFIMSDDKYKSHLKLKTPFCAMVAGPSGSGKTVFVRNLLKYHLDMMTGVNKQLLDVIWCYGCWQDGYKEEVPNVNIKYVDGLTSQSEIEEHRPHLIVIDDLMSELGGDKNLTNLFTKVSHHMNVNIIFITQNIFHHGKEIRTISLNCHYIVALKNVRDRAQILNLGRQLYPSDSGHFREAFEDATSTPFSYLLIDMKPDTPDELRLRSKVLPDERIKGKIAPIIYTSKRG